MSKLQKLKIKISFLEMGPRRSILINSPLKRSSKSEIEINKTSILKSKTLVQNFVRRDSFGHMITKGGK